MMQTFQNRRDAGRQLAAKLKAYKNHVGIFVFGLARGGMVVAYEVAKELEAPLDVFLVRKLGVPWEPELAMGAIAEGGVTIINQNIVAGLNITEKELRHVIEQEKKELVRRQRIYRGHRTPPIVQGREIILVDDGLATGATMQAAVKALKERGAKRIIIAVPVGETETCNSLRPEADDVICLLTPCPFEAIGNWYEQFEQTTDEEVVGLLARSQSKYLLNGYWESEIQHNENAEAN